MRAYDTKAQIVGIGYIFSLNIIGKIEDSISRSSDPSLLGILIAWGIVILPIILFGYVLYPTRMTAPKLASEKVSDSGHILYIDPEKFHSVDDILDSADRHDPANEMAFELLKVSKLRELKRRRFLRALFAAGVCYTVIFAAQIVRVI